MTNMSKELGILCIVVLKAQHLPDKHTFYKQDPYVKLSLSGATQQTPVDPKGGQHPVWDCELRFPISRDPSKSNRTLTISVLSKEKKDDELLGEATVDITDTLKSGEFDEWVPLSIQGAQQRGDVYLEMTFFAAGPAPLTRRPSKFTNPTERLARPQQPPAQRQRIVSQPHPSLLSPGAQGSRTNSHEGTQEGSRQGRSPVQQMRLPGAWPGPSGQQQQQQPTQPAAPSHLNRRSSKSDDAPLPPIPREDAGPKEEALPSILRPGGPSRTTMQPIHETGAILGTPARERYSAGSPSPPFANGYHNTMPSDTDRNTYRPQSVYQNSPQLPASLASHAHIHSPSPPPQSHVQQPTQRTPEHVGFSSGGHGTAQPFPQAQPALTHAQYHSQQPPSRQPQQGQHSPPQQAQPPAGQPSHHTPPYAPDSHLTQPYSATPGQTFPGQSYVGTTSPAPPRPYVASQTPSPPALSQTVNQNASPLPHAQPYATPDLSARPFAASPSPAPSVLPTQPYVTTASSIPPTQPYAVGSVPSVQPYTHTSSVPPAQSFVSSTSTILSPPVHPPAQSTTPSPPLQSYISSPNSIFPLQTSPPPISYGPSYAPALSFPTPSFPVPHTPAVGPFSPLGEPEPDLPDPYLLRRYQAPLPLPAAAPRTHGPGPNAHQQPSPLQPRPAVAPAPAATGARRNKRENADERAARELQHLEEERARARREQEERDEEFARTLDMELNLGGDDAESAPQGSGRPSLPPLRA